MNYKRKKPVRFKKALSIFLAFILVLALMPAAALADEAPPMSVEDQRALLLAEQPGALFEEDIAGLQSPVVIIDGNAITVPPGEPKSILRNDRTYVAGRFFVEHMGGTVKGDPDNPGHWWASLGGKTIEGYAGNTYVTVNGVITLLDAPLFITYTWTGTYFGGRNYLPLRFLSEEFGFDVEWYKDTVILSSTPEYKEPGKETADFENLFANLQMTAGSLQIETPFGLLTVKEKTFADNDLISAVAKIAQRFLNKENLLDFEAGFDFTYGQPDNPKSGHASVKTTIKRLPKNSTQSWIMPTPEELWNAHDPALATKCMEEFSKAEDQSNMEKAVINSERFTGVGEGFELPNIVKNVFDIVLPDDVSEDSLAVEVLVKITGDAAEDIESNLEDWIETAEDIDGELAKNLKRVEKTMKILNVISDSSKTGGKLVTLDYMLRSGKDPMMVGEWMAYNVAKSAYDCANLPDTLPINIKDMNAEGVTTAVTVEGLSAFFQNRIDACEAKMGINRSN